MDLNLSGLRDRRAAASDEYTDRSERRRTGRHIYARGTSPRRASERWPDRFDVRRFRYSRDPLSIKHIVLHCTDGTPFTSTDLPPSMTDERPGSYHRVDEIIAHFVILRDGVIVYTRDVLYSLNNAGARDGIDIEFAGSFSHRATPPTGSDRRVTPAAIRAGRTLVRHLTALIPAIKHINPHGQIQTVGTGKRDSCPGPDIWVNVGEWAIRELGLTSEAPARLPRRGTPYVISDAQRNDAYRQDV